MAWTPAQPVATILDPGDPALGSSYEDGVERARRVTLKKKKKPGELGEISPPLDAQGRLTILSQDDNRLLRDIGAPLDTLPGDLEAYRKLRGGAQYTALGG